jgi:hypothetical protein
MTVNNELEKDIKWRCCGQIYSGIFMAGLRNTLRLDSYYVLSWPGYEPRTCQKQMGSLTAWVNFIRFVSNSCVAGSHRSKYEGYCLLWCEAIQSRSSSLMFRRNLLPPSSLFLARCFVYSYAQKMETILLSETSIRLLPDHSTLRHILGYSTLQLCVKFATQRHESLLSDVIILTMHLRLLLCRNNAICYHFACT